MSKANIGAARNALCAAAMLLVWQAAPANAEGNAQSGAPAHPAACSGQGGVALPDRQACLKAEYLRLDRELNVTYKAVMKQLKTRSLRNRLVESQRAWIWRRDNDCKVAAGGTGPNDAAASSLAYDTCRIDAVARRMEWLRKVPENPDYLRKV